MIAIECSIKSCLSSCIDKASELLFYSSLAFLVDFVKKSESAYFISHSLRLGCAQTFNISHWRRAKHTRIFAAKLGGAFIPHLIGSVGRIGVFGKHQATRF
jgi:hypothetical protein